MIHRVERAIIMAAGLGTRLRPVTDTIPKPLIKVNGIRIIDSVIAGLQHNGITEIYIVVGYLKEMFFDIEKQYNGIKLIENPYYLKCNNISSLYVAKDYLENSIILDGDQLIYNDGILSPEFDKSGYNAVWTEEHTDEWLMQVKDGKVVSCSREGGTHGWQLFSISRWTAEDGARLKRHLEEEFVQNKNVNLYWDDVVMFCHFNEYELGITKMKYSDIIEIDNLEELVALDSTYIHYKEV